MFSSRMWYLQVYVRGSKQFGRFTRKFLTTYFATKLFVEFVEQSTLVKEDEGSHLPNCQEILGIDTLELSLLFLAFHKHSSLTLGLIRAFYKRAPCQWPFCYSYSLLPWDGWPEWRTGSGSFGSPSAGRPGTAGSPWYPFKSWGLSGYRNNSALTEMKHRCDSRRRQNQCPVKTFFCAKIRILLFFS